MLTKEEVLKLMTNTETFRVEKTISTTNMDKFGEAICAFIAPSDVAVVAPEDSLKLTLKMTLKNKSYLSELQDDNNLDAFLLENGMTLKKTLKLTLKKMLSVIALIETNSQVTREEMAKAISVSPKTLERMIIVLKDGIITRKGPEKGGHWIINWEQQDTSNNNLISNNE